MNGAIPAPSGAEIMDRALHPAGGDSPNAVADLVRFARGRRPPLEAAQSLLIARLHGRSDDFGATRALSAVERGAEQHRLGDAPRSDPPALGLDRRATADQLASRRLRTSQRQSAKPRPGSKST